VLNCWVTDPNDTPSLSKISTSRAKSTSDRVSRSKVHGEFSQIEFLLRIFLSSLLKIKEKPYAAASGEINML
jgi:hypothetical protein